MAGLSRMAITKACKGKLAEACVGDRVDAGHPAVVDYLKGRTPTPVAAPRPAPKAPKKKAPAKKKKTPTKKKAGAKSSRPAPATAVAKEAEPAPEIQMGFPDEIDGVEPYASMTLRELIAKFGSRRAFDDWLKALKKIEDIRKVRLDNDEAEGRLIDRELVVKHVMGAIDEVFRRLLMDAPKTITARIYSSALAGDTIEAARDVVHGLIRDQLRALKAKATRNLRKKKTA